MWDTVPRCIKCVVDSKYNLYTRCRVECCINWCFNCVVNSRLRLRGRENAECIVNCVFKGISKYNLYMGKKMSFFKKMLNKPRPPFTLKAKNVDGEWEEIDVFDKYMSFSELKDDIIELRKEGYYYFQLVDARGKPVWSKRYKRDVKTGMKVEDIEEIVKRYKALKDLMREIVSEGHVDPYEVLASGVSMLTSIRRLCSEFPEICGTGGGISGFDAGLRVVKWLIDWLGGGSLEKAEEVLEAITGIKLRSGGKKVSSEVAKKSITSEGKEWINKVAAESVKKATEIVKSECEAMGTCGEGESGGEYSRSSKGEVEEA